LEELQRTGIGIREGPPEDEGGEERKIAEVTKLVEEKWISA